MQYKSNTLESLNNGEYFLKSVESSTSKDSKGDIGEILKGSW